MPNQDHKTKDFLQKIENLIAKGLVKNHAEVVTALNWNKSVMSSVKTGALPVPQHIYIKFKEVFAEQLEQLKAKKDLDVHDVDYKDKYIALLEKQLKDQEEYNKRITAVEQVLTEVRRNQRVMYAVLTAFQETVLPVLAPGKKGIAKAFGELAVQYLEKYQREEIAISV